MWVFSTAPKVAHLRQLSRRMLLVATRNQRLVIADAVRHFCGVAVSISLGYPLQWNYMRSIFSDLACAERKERGKSLHLTKASACVREQASSGETDFARAMTATPRGLGAPTLVVIIRCFRGRVRLSRESLRDLQHWPSMTTGNGRKLKTTATTIALHTDATDLGYV